MNELKPCPFCGSEAKLFYCDTDGKYRSNVSGSILHGIKLDYKVIVCEKCGVRTKTYSTNRVFNAWNRRLEDGTKRID